MRWMIAGVGALALGPLTQFAIADEYKPVRPSPAAAAPAAPAANWSGFQTGAFGGNSSLAQNFAEPGAKLCPGTPIIAIPSSPDCPETPFHFNGHPSSFTAGGFLGYRVQFGVLVVGVEGDAAWKNAKTSLTQMDTTELGVKETFAGSLEQGWDGSLRGRVGVLLAPWLLAYGTGGGAIGNVSGAFGFDAQGPSPVPTPTPTRTLVPPPSVSGAGSWSETRVGYTAGGGLEAALGAGLKARFEYRFTDFGHISHDVPLTSMNCTGGCTSGTNARIDTNASFQTFRLGLGIDF